VLAVKVEEVATPLALVVSVSVRDEFEANVPLAPVAGAVNVTEAPLTGFELLSTTVATSGAPKAVLMVAFCNEPLVAAIDAGGPDVLVRLKVVVAVTPATEPVTGSAPMIPLAVKVDEVATPLALVVSVSVLVELDAKVPLAPVAGAVKTTNAPLTGCPPSITVATRGAANAVLSLALCGDPPVAATVSVGGVKFELLQPVRKNKARRIEPTTLPEVRRFTVIRLSDWHAHAPAATRGNRAGCGWYRSRHRFLQCGPEKLTWHESSS
jgi:hypothetical protein